MSSQSSKDNNHKRKASPSFPSSSNKKTKESHHCSVASSSSPVPQNVECGSDSIDEEEKSYAQPGHNTGPLSTTIAHVADVSSSVSGQPPPCVSEFVYPDNVNNLKPEEHAAAMKDVRYLLVTVNDHEWEAVFKLLRPVSFNGADVFLEASDAGLDFYFDVIIGKYGVHQVATVRAAMGIGSIGSISNVIHALQPCLPQLRSVINVGVAYGASRAKQKLGDVLVSTQIADVASVRNNSNGSIDFRGSRPEASQRLVSRAKSAASTFRCHREVSLRFDTHFGPILSAPALNDNAEAKKVLLNHHPDAVGGEMEGIDLIKAAIAKGLEWILVKGICDWGDGDKEKSWQPVAAERAARLVFNMLEKQDKIQNAASNNGSNGQSSVGVANGTAAVPAAASSNLQPAPMSNTVHNNSGIMCQGTVNVHNHAAAASTPRERPRQRSMEQLAAERRRQSLSAEDRDAGHARGSLTFSTHTQPSIPLVSLDDLEREPRLASIGRAFGEAGYGLPIYFQRGTKQKFGRGSSGLAKSVRQYFDTNSDLDDYCFRGDFYDNERFTQKEREKLLKYNISSTGNTLTKQLRYNAGF